MVLSEILRLSVRLCASLSAGHVCPAESAMILSRHVVRWVMGIKTLPWGLSGTMRLRNRCHASVCILEDSGTSLLAAPNGLKGFVRFLCVVGSDLLPPPSQAVREFIYQPNSKCDSCKDTRLCPIAVTCSGLLFCLLLSNLPTLSGTLDSSILSLCLFPPLAHFLPAIHLDSPGLHVGCLWAIEPCGQQMHGVSKMCGACDTADTLILDLQNCWRVNFCYFKPPSR